MISIWRYWGHCFLRVFYV